MFESSREYDEMKKAINRALNNNKEELYANITPTKEIQESYKSDHQNDDTIRITESQVPTMDGKLSIDIH